MDRCPLSAEAWQPGLTRTVFVEGRLRHQEATGHRLAHIVHLPVL